MAVPAPAARAGPPSRASRRPCFLTCARMVYFPRMNKSDLKEIKDIVNSALETHLASVHEEITDLRRDMDAKFAEVDARFTAVEERIGSTQKSTTLTKSSATSRTGRLISGCSLKSASRVSKSSALERPASPYVSRRHPPSFMVEIDRLADVN